MLPSNISVSDLKKKEFTYGDEVHDTVEVFKEKEVLSLNCWRRKGCGLEEDINWLCYERMIMGKDINKTQWRKCAMDGELTKKLVLWVQMLY